MQMDKNDTLKGVDEGSEKANKVDGLIKTWEGKHLKRFAVTGPALLLALLALMLDGRS